VDILFSLSGHKLSSLRKLDGYKLKCPSKEISPNPFDVALIIDSLASLLIFEPNSS
jgi:hypothetical protein